MTKKYNRETNPMPTFKYEILRLAADKNSCEVLESYDTLQEAVDKHKSYTETDIKINLRPANDR
jgi:hypothetical protein